MSPFNDSVVRPSVKKKPTTGENKTSNLVKIGALGIMALGVVIANSLLPITAGENSRRDTINVLGGVETSSNCTSTGCIQSIVGITESMDLYNLSGAYVIGEPANPRCELSSTGALQGSSCVITAGVSILGTVSGMMTQTAADARYVNTSGDTMTGALKVRATMSGTVVRADNTLASSGALIVLGNGTLRGTMSGNVIHAEKSLSSSGSITAEGTISGAILIARTASGQTVRYTYISPAKLGGFVVGSGSTVATGSGKTFFPVLKSMSGYLLYDAQMEVMTAGTTNVTSLQVRNANKGNCKMFSTVISIDSAETSSLTAATPFVVNGSCNNVGGGERLLVDIPGVSTTVPKVITLVLYFYKP